jgi:hypothetical protein
MKMNKKHGRLLFFTGLLRKERKRLRLSPARTKSTVLRLEVQHEKMLK